VSGRAHPRPGRGRPRPAPGVAAVNRPGPGGPLSVGRPGGDGRVPPDRPGGDGRAPGYRPGRTLTIAAEWRRQAGRRRTRLLFAVLVALPLVMLAAFQIGGDDEGQAPSGGRFSSMVDLATTGGLNFALFTVFVSSGFLLVVVVAVVFGDPVASEAAGGSLRYLLAAPVPRGRLLAAKAVVAGLTSLLAMLTLTGTALLAGTLRYGWHPLRSTVAAELSPGEGLVRLLLVLGYLAVSLLAVAAVAFLLSVSTDAPLGAVGGAVLLFIVSSILDEITALGGVRTFLPTHFSDAWLGLLSTPLDLDGVVRGTVSALGYGAGLFALAWWRFLRRDITS
jgi:ABC-2 type transport system permease protein